MAKTRQPINDLAQSENDHIMMLSATTNKSSL